MVTGGVIILAIRGVVGTSPIGSAGYAIILMLGGVAGTILGMIMGGGGEARTELAGVLVGLLLGATWGALSRAVWNLVGWILFG